MAQGKTSGKTSGKTRQEPDFLLEAAAIRRGAGHVGGVDEVGRGPLCGPVVAAAVILDPRNLPKGLNDSKLLTPACRAALVPRIEGAALALAVCEASVQEIDRLNILGASLLAMRRAVAALAPIPDHLLIDGDRLPDGLPCRADAVVKGDTRSVSIAAASILAKVARDRMMVDLAQQYPGYGWEHNAGYATKAHLQALLDLGPSPVHRRSFAPVRNMLWQHKSTTP